MNENEQLLDFVEETKKILYSNNINKLGEILNKSWIVKKTLSGGISSNEIDKLCKKILNSGASGVKISGAGGGGFALSFCTLSKQKNFIKKLGRVNYEKINIENFGTRIIHASS
jgi:D-glycero-alpha-D-manno-heptose-7-phosphate kinase